MDTLFPQRAEVRTTALEDGALHLQGFLGGVQGTVKNAVFKKHCLGQSFYEATLRDGVVRARKDHEGPWLIFRRSWSCPLAKASRGPPPEMPPQRFREFLLQHGSAVREGNFPRFFEAILEPEVLKAFYPGAQKPAKVPEVVFGPQGKLYVRVSEACWLESVCREVWVPEEEAAPKRKRPKLTPPPIKEPIPPETEEFEVIRALGDDSAASLDAVREMEEAFLRGP